MKKRIVCLGWEMVTGACVVDIARQGTPNQAVRAVSTVARAMEDSKGGAVVTVGPVIE